MAVEHIEDVQGAFLRDNWHALLERSTRGTPFSTWAWHRAMVARYGGNLRPFLITAWDGPRLIALASLARTTERMGLSRCVFLGCGPRRYSMADCQDVLVAAGEEAAGLRQVVSELSRSLKRWDIVDLKEIPADSPTVSALTTEAHRQGLKTVVESMGPRYVIVLPSCWEAYLARLSKNMRSSLERKTRKLAREHDIHFSVVSQESQVDRYMDLLERLHTARWREKGFPGIFAMEGAREFHRSIAHEFLRQGMLDLMGLWVDGQPAAITYNFRFGGTLYNYASGFDTRAELARYSLGMVMNGFMIRRAIEEGFTRIDLLRGDEHYKAHYGVTPQGNVRVLMFKTGHAYIGHLVARQVKRWLRPVKARITARWRSTGSPGSPRNDEPPRVSTESESTPGNGQGTSS